MVTRKLKLGLAGVLTCLSMMIFTSSCKNENKPENNSTASVDATTTDPKSEVSTVDNAFNSDPSSPAVSQGTRTNPGRNFVTTTPMPVDKSKAMTPDADGVYNYTQSAPAFPGGQNSLETYINRNIQYPEDAIDNEVEGTVYVLFTIDENGNVRNAKTTNTTIGYGLEEEALRVVKGMTGWIPGSNNGVKVKTWYTIPITYRLADS